MFDCKWVIHLTSSIPVTRRWWAHSPSLCLTVSMGLFSLSRYLQFSSHLTRIIFLMVCWAGLSLVLKPNLVPVSRWGMRWLSVSRELHSRHLHYLATCRQLSRPAVSGPRRAPAPKSPPVPEPGVHHNNKTRGHQPLACLHPAPITLTMKCYASLNREIKASVT